MFRPLAPALGAVAVVLLTACSDSPLGPRSIIDHDVPGINAGPGSTPAGTTAQDPAASDTGAPAADDPSTPPANSPDDSQSEDGDEPDDDSQGGEGSPADSGTQDTGSTDSQETGSQPSGDESSGDPSSGSQDSGSQDSGSQDSGSQDPGSSTGSSSNPSTPPAGGPSGQQGGSQNGGNPNGGNGVSSPVSLGGTVQVEVPGGEIVGYRSNPQPAAAGGFCGNGENGYPLGTWVKPAGPSVSVHPNHAHCVERSEAATITVTFSIAATYIVAPAGNIQLNLGLDRHIHYKAQQNATSGQGVLLGEGTDGSVWELDLSQVQHSGHTRPAVPDGINPLHRRYTALTAVRQGGSALTAQVTLAW